MACKDHTILAFIAIVLSVKNVHCSSDESQNEFQVIHEWKTLDFNWPSQAEKEESLKNGSFIEKNTAISGIKIWKDRIYLTVPRQLPGVPVTLARLPENPSKTPILEAFPNWAMQKLGDCSALQLVQSIEIDTEGRMWIIDAGRVDVLELVPPPPKCPPKLVIIDLNSDEFPVIRSYVFPDLVASYSQNYLNDIVIDSSNGGFAYISDLGKNNGIVVYSFQENRAWKVAEEVSMSFNPLIPVLKVNDAILTDPILTLGNVDGIALSPVTSDGSPRTLYYCPLVSYDLYSISTEILQDQPLLEVVPITDVKHEGTKKTITDGMMMDNQGILHFGLIQSNELAVWDTKSGDFSENYKVMAKNDTTLQWADGFAIDDAENLYVVTNKLQDLILQKVDTSVVNYRISKKFIGSRSYLYE